MFFIFLLHLFFSNLSAYMIRIFYNSRPVLDVNTVSIINLYIVEILNFIVTLVSTPCMWVSLVSYLPFAISYVLGLLVTYMGYFGGGLASAVEIIKMLKVLQVKIITSLSNYAKSCVFGNLLTSQNMKVY